jgi:hypothetical protein
VVAAYLPQAGQTASRAVRRALAEAVDTRDVRPTPNGRVSFSATCGLVPSFAVGAVERDPCPAVPVTPKTQPLAGKRLRVAIAQPVSPEGGPPYSPDLEAAARMVKAIKALGGTATVIETRLDPLTLLTVGRADLAIARFTTRLPHPSFWLDTAAQFDALLAREVPRETRGPLTGSGGRWAALERRAVDRAVAIPLLSLQRVVTIGPQIDRRTVLIHPVLGLDLAALDLA